jgi:vacuolar protein sorting-associated protein 53
LLKALQKTIVFEKEVSAGLQSQFGVVFVDQNTDGDDNAKPKTPSTVPSKDKNRDQGGAPKEQTPVESLLGLASSAFDKHMRPYIALEEQSMDEQLVSALEDRTVDLRGSHPVLTSSTQMFVYIRGSITRCTALTKGNTFFLLYKSFQDCLRKYAQVLISKLPPSTSQKPGGALMPPVPFGKQSILDSSSPYVESYHVPPGEEVTVCHVVGTAEYCAETVEALEDLIRDTIDDEFKSKIDMSDEQEAFHDITAKAIGVLVSGIENRLSDAFRMMETTNWGAFLEVGEESEYIGAMNKLIHVS